MEIQAHTHQIEALTAIRTAITGGQSGRVVIPTGGGKTFIEAHTLRDRINSSTDTKIHLVLAPRIVLVNQLAIEYYKFIGQDYIAILFHSSNDIGSVKSEYTFRDIKRTTSQWDVMGQIERAKREGRDCVVFSTYASFDNLSDIEFDTVIADESQYCVQENNYNNIGNIVSKYKFFFTATEKHTIEGGRGLNNTEVFGDVIYQVNPKTLIERGIIVAPRLHVMYGESKPDSDTVVDQVINVTKAQQEETSKRLNVTKVLFAMKGTKDVESVIQYIDRIKASLPEFKVFTILSKAEYGAMIDGVKVSRGDFMSRLAESTHAIICHYDILAEGIDVDGITGVALLRNLTHAKLLQTIGRALRVYKANPDAKKTALVTVPVINNDEESKAVVSEVLGQFLSEGYDINIEEVLYTGEDGFGIGDADQIDDQYDLDTKKRVFGDLSNVIHNIQEERGLLAFMTEKKDTKSRLAALASL